MFSATFDKLMFCGSRYRLNLATCTELRQVADEALNAGYYSSSLVDAALDAENILWEVGPAFVAALAELKVVVPESTEECIWIVLHYPTQQIATLAVEPEVGLASIMEVYRGCNLYDRSQNFVGDSHDVQHLIGAYWEYDEIWERYGGAEFQEGQRQARDLDKDVIGRCQVWLNNHTIEMN